MWHGLGAKLPRWTLGVRIARNETFFFCGLFGVAVRAAPAP